MRARVTCLMLGLLFAGGAWAQDAQTVSLGQRGYDVFDLSPSAPGHTYAFTVAPATQLVIDVTSRSAAVGVSVTDPLGSVLDPTSFQRFAVTDLDAPPLGALFFEPGEHVQVVVDAPRTGNWTINLALPSGAPPTLGTITTVATGGLGVGATTSRPFYQAGEPAVLALVAFEGPNPVTGAAVSAGLYQVGSELTPTSVTLLDDGADPDTTAGDGVYTAAIDGLAPGSYLAEVTLTTGGVSTTAGATFDVVPASARFDGTRTDTGVDTNSDGLFDYVRVDFGLSVAAAGTFDVFTELRVPGTDAVLRAATRATLAAGARTAGVRFDAADLRRYLAADGPWEVRNARLVKVATDGASPDVPADHVDDFGLTNTYTLGQLQRPLTLILSGITEQAYDTNGNGLYDVLSVGFRVDTRRSGFYTWTGDLRAPDGTNLGVAAGQGFLGVGVSTLAFGFQGRPIGASGLDGPYTVGNVAVYGPFNAAAVSEAVGQTRAYTSSQFEGGQVTFQRLIDEVKALIITGPGGIPRAQGIRTSLLQKAQNAQAQAERGNNNAAANILGAFINEVQAQTGAHIAPADADRLIDLATRLRTAL